MSPALVAVAALTLSAVSSSKFGAVVLGDGSDATSQTLLAVCPRFAVFRLTDVTQATALNSVISSYKANCAGAKVLVQVGTPGMQVDINTVSSNWVSAWSPEIIAAGANLIDAIEGPSDPVPVTPNSTTDIPNFWASFVAQVPSVGAATPVVGVTGMPSLGANDEFCATVAAITASSNWAWSYHARSPTMSTSATTEAGSALAYRQIATDCPGLAGKILYVTEAGRSSGAWHVAPAPSDLDWIAFFDGELQIDGASVFGAALFQTGSTASFDLTPIAPQLASYLQNPTPTDGGVTDGGADGGDAGRGGVAQGGPPIGGSLNPSNPKSGCSTGGAGLVILALSPALYVLRRRAPRR